MARTDAGLTISELAARAGVSRDTISNAEKGRHGLQATTLHKLARALGRTPSELLAEEERLAPTPPRRSPYEPSLLNGLEEERPERVVKDSAASAHGRSTATARPAEILDVLKRVARREITPEEGLRRIEEIMAA